MSTNKLKIPKRATEITPFYVMDILEKAKEMEAAGKDVIHLEVGEPDFQTPDCIKEKAIKTITEGKLGYTPSLGLIELRKAIAGRYKEKYGVNILPEQVVVTSGSSPALQMVFSCLLEEGDEVIMTDPHYACYSNFVKFLGGKPLLIKTEEDENFRLSPDEIKKNMTGKSKVILINSPANPTGVVMSAADMEAVSALGLTVISDEIYHGLVYDGNEHSILEFDKDAFVIDGFSKRYAMTGWRLGYAVVPQRY
ncbi:MAG: aminotransferase class I/II-fold pyridoxal phosphate-dependent enzyme, partial [Proteobacteria bacterium]|nr:aminotransferase class I/II-fold pyridoxal phosphate-dependent enzyme [Pseudomonadota bacterium]